MTDLGDLEAQPLVGLVGLMDETPAKNGVPTEAG